MPSSREPAEILHIILFVNKFDWAQSEEQKVKNSIDLCTPLCVWNCMNEIYPDWFDYSIHPDAFASSEDAMLTLLHFLEEYHDLKYKSNFDPVKKQMSELFQGDAHLTLLLYEMIVLSTIHADNPKIFIDRIISLPSKTQLYLQGIIEKFTGVRSSAPSKAANANAYDNPSLPDEKFSSNAASSSTPGGVGSSSLVGSTAQFIDQIKELTQKLIVAETAREELVEKLKISQDKLKEMTQAKENLENLLSQSKAETRSSLLSQAEDLEKQISEYKNFLEEEKKEKKALEEVYKNKLKDQEDEMALLKSQATRVSGLELQLTKFRGKLEELNDLNKALEAKLGAAESRVEAQGDLKESANLKKAIDTLKQRNTHMEEQIVELRNERDQLILTTQELQATNYQLDMKMRRKEAEIDNLIADKEVQDLQLRKSESVYSNSLDTEVALGRDAWKSKVEENASSTEKTAEEGLSGRNKKLEIALEAANMELELYTKQKVGLNTKIKFLETQLEEACGDEGAAKKISELSEKLGEAEKAKESLFTEMKSLRESKDELTGRLMQIMNERSNRPAEIEEVMKAKIEVLESKLEAEKHNMKLQENNLKSKMDEQFDQVVNILKEQVTLREEENNALRNSLHDNSESNDKELRIVLELFYGMAMKYHTLKLFNEQISEEYDALMHRIEENRQNAAQDMKNQMQKSHSDFGEDSDISSASKGEESVQNP